MWVSGCEKETRKREDEEEKEETSGRRRNGGSRRRRSRGYTWNVLACVYSQHAKLVGKVHLHCMESSLLMRNCLGSSMSAPRAIGVFKSSWNLMPVFWNSYEPKSDKYNLVAEALFKSVQSGWLFEVFFVVHRRIQVVAAVEGEQDRVLTQWLHDPGNVDKQRALDAARLEMSSVGAMTEHRLAFVWPSTAPAGTGVRQRQSQIVVKFEYHFDGRREVATGAEQTTMQAAKPHDRLLTCAAGVCGSVASWLTCVSRSSCKSGLLASWRGAQLVRLLVAGDEWVDVEV